MFTFAAIAQGNFFPIIPVVLLLVSFWFVDRGAYMQSLPYSVRLVSYLALLLVLTMITDFCLYGKWQSLVILLDGGQLMH